MAPYDVASSICQALLADVARDVIQSIVNPRFSSYMAPYDVVGVARHVIQCILNPRFFKVNGIL